MNLIPLDSVTVLTAVVMVAVGITGFVLGFLIGRLDHREEHIIRTTIALEHIRGLLAKDMERRQ